MTEIHMLFSQNANTNDCFEIISLEFKETVSLEQQQEAMASLNALITELAGFQSRDYFYSKDNGRWIEFITWSDEALAKKASDEMMKNEQALEVFCLVNEKSMIFSHYQHSGGISA